MIDAMLRGVDIAGKPVVLYNKTLYDGNFEIAAKLGYELLGMFPES